MKGYVLRRLLLMVPTLFGITLALFLLVQLVPGGPVEETLSKVREAAAQTGGADASRTISQEEIPPTAMTFSHRASARMYRSPLSALTST